MKCQHCVETTSVLPTSAASQGARLPRRRLLRCAACSAGLMLTARSLWPTSRTSVTALAATAPQITDVTGSDTPNGFAGYLVPGEPFTLYSSTLSFGAARGTVAIAP